MASGENKVEINKMKPNCKICGTPARFLMKKDGYDEYLCPRCGYSFIYPEPNQEWLKDEVYSYESGYQANKNADLSLAKPDKVSRKILKFLKEEKPNGTLLDIGCSSGQFMYWAKQEGFETAGVEINKRTADIAKANGLDVFNGFLKDSSFPKKSFDAIFIGDVIEHVGDPKALINEADEFLKGDGIIVISTPNTDCFWSRATLALHKLFRIPWAVATPPHHISQFGFSNLNLLLGKSGYAMRRAFFAPPPSLRYELGSLHLYKRWKSEKNAAILFYMIFSFTLYTVVYGLNLLLGPILEKDFRMIIFYAKD